MATVNITVEVHDYDGSNKFQINGLRQKIVVANAGDTIDFDQSDSSNAGHPLVIALYHDGDHNTNGNEYTTGVTTAGTPGQAGAKTTFTVSDADLHGTYYYYCKNHAGMGGMIHYGSDSIPSGQTVPAKYRIIDEGATADDDQDGDITSSIETTAELYDPSLDPPWGVLYDSSLYQVSHTNPWAVINTDTRESAVYRVKYNVTDSAGVSARTQNKYFYIGESEKPFLLPPEYNSPCTPTSSQLEGYIYDDNHFVLTFAGSLMFIGEWFSMSIHSITRIFCYGTDSQSVTMPTLDKLSNGSGSFHGWLGLPWKINDDEYPLFPAGSGYGAMLMDGGDCIHTSESLAEIVGSNWVGAQWHTYAYYSTGAPTGYREGHAKTERSRPDYLKLSYKNQPTITETVRSESALETAHNALPKSSHTYIMPRWCTEESDGSGHTSGTVEGPLGQMMFDEAIGSQMWTIDGYYDNPWPREGVQDLKPYSGTYDDQPGWWYPTLAMSDMNAHRVDRGLTDNHKAWFDKYAIVPYNGGNGGFTPAVTIHPIKRL